MRCWNRPATVQARVRALPSRVVVYLLLAAALFAELGYGQVWARMIAGLDGIDGRRSGVLGVDAGPSPHRCQTAAGTVRPGPRPRRRCRGSGRWRGLLVCAIDGTSMLRPDTPANLAAFQAGSAAAMALGVSDAADADRGRMRHPHRTRRRLRHLERGRNQLCTKASGLSAPRHAVARRPQFRRRGPDRAGRRNGRRSAVPRQGQPQTPRDQPLRRRLVAVADRHDDHPGDRRPGRRATRRRPTSHRALPADHHPHRPSTIPRHRTGCPLPPALGDRNLLSGSEIHHPRRPGAARPHPDGIAQEI